MARVHGASDDSGNGVTLLQDDETGKDSSPESYSWSTEGITKCTKSWKAK